jgi:hypothetical protein
LDGADERDDPARGLALERHDRQADDVRPAIADKPAHGFRNGLLREDQVGDADVVVWIEVAGDRCQRPVRHAHRERRRVLERVGHGEKKDLHLLLWGLRPNIRLSREPMST